MNTLNKVLDKARVLCGSDAGIARRLKVTPSAVSLWRSGGKIKPEHLAVLLDFAQQDPALAVQVMAEQEASPEERRMWGTVWDRLSPVTTKVAGVLLACGLALPYQQASATTTQAEPLNPMRIMRSVRRWLRSAWTQAAAWCRHEPPALLA